MNRVFYLFRHGETDWNAQTRCQGHTDIPLNQNGLEQAIRLSQKIKEINMEVVYSSDLARAKITGETVAGSLAIPIFYDQRLREMSYGEAEGLVYQEALEKFGIVWEKLSSFKKANDEIHFPKGETRRQARERFLSALSEIIETTDHQVIGISTHGGAIRNVIHFFLDENHPKIPIPNCVVYKLEYCINTKKFIAHANPAL